MVLAARMRATFPASCDAPETGFPRNRAAKPARASLASSSFDARLRANSARQRLGNLWTRIHILNLLLLKLRRRRRKWSRIYQFQFQSKSRNRSHSNRLICRRKLRRSWTRRPLMKVRSMHRRNRRWFWKMRSRTRSLSRKSRSMTYIKNKRRQSRINSLSKPV